tara:strand:+ start:20 stop:607 length:588 start_codon:yes stop_codon:yes gene_type:complete
MLDSLGEISTDYSNKAQNWPALILNADYRPLSYFPLSLWSWQDAIKAVYLDRVDVVAEYKEVVRSASLILPIPSVIVLKSFIQPSRKVPFSRFNLFLRDEFKCQYCGKESNDLTFDHVIPKCKGGKTKWENVVAACNMCNLKKAAKSAGQVGLKLAALPSKPSPEILLNKGRKFPPQNLHATWRDFLYWDVELEE